MHDIWNPWHGCTKVSAGCKHCYMYYLDKKRGVTKDPGIAYKTKNFDYPLKKDRYGNYIVRSGERLRVNMTSDTFLDLADEWRDDMWSIIRQRSDVIFWLLTKRPERIVDHLPQDWGDGYENVSLNVTCENQEMFDKRWEVFKDIPAKHKGMCLAPLISDIDLTKALKTSVLEEVSAGGENYDNPRICRYEWVKHISDQCKEYHTNFIWYETGTNFVKDGVIHRIPTKSTQQVLAYCADLNCHYYDVDFKLYDEEHRLLPKDTYVPVYNVNHCMCCSNRGMCNGCDPNCMMDPHSKRVSLEQIEELEKAFLNDQVEIASHRKKNN